MRLYPALGTMQPGHIPVPAYLIHRPDGVILVDTDGRGPLSTISKSARLSIEMSLRHDPGALTEIGFAPSMCDCYLHASR